MYYDTINTYANVCCYNA